MAITLETANNETIIAKQTDKTRWRENIPDFLDVIFLVNRYCIKVRPGLSNEIYAQISVWQEKTAIAGQTARKICSQHLFSNTVCTDRITMQSQP
jgi:hypothetical protein